ncbi:MAG: Uma2 family endonuclease [Gemmatimonadaceae bacterium]
MPATTLWTADMVRALPDDGKRYEVIDGELFVTPAPTLHHQRAAFTIAKLLSTYVAQHAIGDVLLAPADVLTAKHVMVQPDVLVAPLIEGRKPASWDEVGRLLVAVEVLSPSTARADRHVKRRLYQRQRVAEYWIVDLDARLVERWRPEDQRPEILDERLAWRPDPAHPALVIDLAAYFCDVIGE